MKPRVIMACAIAAIAALALILLRQRWDPPRPIVDETDAPADRVGNPVPESRRAVETRPIVAARFVEPGESPVRPDDDDALRVLVIDETTRLPAAGAEVVWNEVPPFDIRVHGALSYAPPLLARFDQIPNRTTTDARGIAFVRTSPELHVAARRGGSFGLREFTTAPRGEIRLVMGPGPLIAARVVDEAGSPVAGVHVMFWIDSRKSGGSSSAVRGVMSREPDGLAITHHPGIDRSRFGGEVTVTASVSHPIASASASVPLSDFESGPITLVIPASGRVVVRLTDPRGAPVTSESRVWLKADPVSQSKTSQTMLLLARTHAGVAVWTGVPLGVPLSVIASTADFDSVVDHPIGAIVGAGRELTTEVRFEHERCVLVGRAVDELGSPLGDRDLRVDVVTLGQVRVSDAPDQARTDAGGNFKVVLDRKLFVGRGCELDLEIDSADGSLDRAAIVPVREVSAVGEFLLGEIRMLRPRRLAAGIVVDENERPLENALVTIEHLNVTHSGGVTLGGRGSTRQPRQESLRARTDADGAFEIPCPPRLSVRSFSVAAELEGYVLWYAPAAQEKGTTSVKVTLLGAGVVEGRILLPEAAPVRDLELRVTRIDGDKETSRRYEDLVDSDGRFRLNGILPGRVTLAVRLAKGDDLAVLAGIEVERFRVAADPRLQGIDLRSHAALRR